MNCDTFFTIKDKRYFKEQLARQLRFIRNSCRLYDEGNKEEAIRIGTSLRVLMRDTTDRKGRPLSVSLFSHLKAKDKIKINSLCYHCRRERIEEMERDRDTLLDNYARVAPEALSKLLPEERHQVYRMLRLRIVVKIEGTLEVSGALAEGAGFCTLETCSWPHFR